MKKIRNVSAVLLSSMFVVMSCASLYASDTKDKIVPEKNIKAHKIIRLHYMGGITPTEITVEPGTTVIWVNDSRSPVEIQFEGQQVTMACKSPVHFIVDEKGSFVSDRIPQGSVASLCFVEKGEYTYVARKAPTGSTYERRESVKEFKGKVIVE